MTRIERAYRFIYNPLTRVIHEMWAYSFPMWYAKYMYKKMLGKQLNLTSPRDLNEKIQWLKIFSDTSTWTELTDKYKVREYIDKCGLNHILPKLYGVWSNAHDINFSSLPEKFILKTNQSYGRAVIVKNKEKIDQMSIRKQFNIWVKDRYGLLSFEPHCWNIQRRIIAEELLEDRANSEVSSSLIDYKVWCFHGEPYLIMVLYDRNNKTIGGDTNNTNLHTQACIYDLDWNLRPEILSGSHKDDIPLIIPKPKCFDELIEVSKKLAKQFPQVRVDLYVVNDKVYFGELTFTSLGGYMDYFTDEYLLKMGDQIDLSRVQLRTSRFIV